MSSDHRSLGGARLAVLLIVAAALFTGSGCALTRAAEPETVIVAADLALTGSGAWQGQVFENALRLRAEQVNQRALLGKRRLELRVVDNRSDPDTSLANLTELAADPEVSAIVTGGCDRCVVDAADTIDTARVPTIALAAADAVAQPVGERRYVFKLGPNAASDADVLVAALAAAGVTTIGAVTGDDAYGADGLRDLSDAAVASGIDLVVQERLGRGGEQELAAAAARIAGWSPEAAPLAQEQAEPAEPAAGPDAVVVWLPEPQATAAAVALREAGWRNDLYLDASAAGELFVGGEAAEALDGARLLFTETLVIDDVIAVTPAKARRKEWFRDYLSRHGTYHAYSSLAADAINVIAAAVERVDSTERDPLRGAIEAIRIDGLTGPIGFTPSNHSGLDPLALRLLVFSGDRWRLSA
jgi:branched-chain amino acid transport system substrate-binding protein